MFIFPLFLCCTKINILRDMKVRTASDTLMLYTGPWRCFFQTPLIHLHLTDAFIWKSLQQREGIQLKHAFEPTSSVKLLSTTVIRVKRALVPKKLLTWVTWSEKTRQITSHIGSKWDTTFCFTRNITDGCKF